MTVTARKIIEQGILNYYVDDFIRVEQARKQVLLTHPNSEGVVAIAIKPDGKWSQAHLPSDELLLIMNRFMGVENVYLSQGSFQDARSIAGLRQINTLFVDLDFYKIRKDYSAEQICWQLEVNEYNRSIPEPSVILSSGRGLALIWYIESTPAADLPLWQSIEDYLIYALHDYGADTAARDAARVLRIAGTVNSKSGQMAKFIRTYNTEHRYSLKSIAEQYLAVNETKKKPTKLLYKASDKLGRILNVYTLHFSRLKDLEQQSKDGGYIICGETRLYEPYRSIGYLLKLNKDGQKEWENAIGSVLGGTFKYVQQTSDGGYILTGYNTNKFLLVKTDPNGNVYYK